MSQGIYFEFGREGLDKTENKDPSDSYIALYILQKNHGGAADTVLGVCRQTSGIAGFGFVF